jgi:hypothetical protein
MSDAAMFDWLWLPKEDRSVRTAQDYEVGPFAPADEDSATTGEGWLTFAAILLALAGTWNFVDGILAIESSKVFGAHATFVFGGLVTWGWIELILGIIQGFAAFALFAGSRFGPWFGIFAAGLNAIGQLMFVPVYPWWAISMFAVDLLVIYALAVHGGNRLE